MTMKLSLILAICLCGVILSTAQDLDNLTDAQYQRLFHRQRSELPNFKTVTVKSAKKSRANTEVRPVQFEIDGEKTKFKLTPVEANVLYDDVPVWKVRTDSQKSSGHVYEKLDREDVQIDGIFYQDVSKNAMLLAYYKDQNIFYDGIFGESENMKVIRSFPEKWWAEPESEYYRQHVVYDVEAATGQTDLVDNGNQNIIPRRLAEPIQTLYPKLLIVVENNLFKELGEDVSETVKYVATYWNAINLKYSTLTSPKVKVLVTGIIVAEDDTALRYIYDSRDQTNMEQVYHTKMINEGGKYFEKEFNAEVDFKNYDSTFTMAKLSAGGVLGSAYIGTVCVSGLNVGWVRDDASYSGVYPATHELGHLLTLPHDGEGAAKECDSFVGDNGTIMSAFALSVDKLVWSECSKRILSDFASMEDAQCLETRYRN